MAPKSEHCEGLPIFVTSDNDFLDKYITNTMSTPRASFGIGPVEKVTFMHIYAIYVTLYVQYYLKRFYQSCRQK